jgi:chromosome partitioning protein
MKVVSFSIFKGGTGKTTSCVHAASCLAGKGKRVLLIDLDQQGSASRYLGIEPEITPNLYHVFTGTSSAASAIKKTAFGVDILPSNYMMAAIEEALEPGDEEKLSSIIAPLKNEYDFILIDTPPGKAMLSFNGLVAADLIIVPASAQRMAIDGVSDLINHLQRIMWDKFHLDRQEIRILFTMYRATTSHSPGIVEGARKIWRENVLSMKIPDTIEFSRSFDNKTPLNILSPKHPGSLAYNLLADWMIEYEATAT